MDETLNWIPYNSVSGNKLKAITAILKNKSTESPDMRKNPIKIGTVKITTNSKIVMHFDKINMSQK